VPDPANFPDPFALWRDWVSKSERQWNQFLNDVMASDEWNQSAGRLVELQLSMQKSFAESIGRYVAAMNIATRTDVLGLGEHLAAIEARLERIEATLAGRRTEGTPSAAPAAPAAPRPPRTKRPPMAQTDTAAPADASPAEAPTP
jgi:polyhydroxyalkanoic acid synthase PhaR subunit